jgi:polysaccharide export outer membrane protein
MLAACGSTSPPDPQAKKLSPEEVESMLRKYPLRIGDKVKVELSGIPDKMDPMERDIKEDGTINLPFIDNIQAAGKSPSQLEKDITDAYSPTKYVHINVAVTPTARFFYVMGQINNTSGGRYPYTGPITVLQAIATAGDFNAFADRRHVQITRSIDGDIKIVNCRKAIKRPELDLRVYPGDKIFVPRRSF